MRNHKYQDEPSWSKLKTMNQNAAWLIIFTIPIWFPVWLVVREKNKLANCIENTIASIKNDAAEFKYKTGKSLYLTMFKVIVLILSLASIGFLLCYFFIVAILIIYK